MYYSLNYDLNNNLVKMTESLLNREMVAPTRGSISLANNFNSTSFLDSKRSKFSIAVGDQSMTEVIRISNLASHLEAEKRRSVIHMSSSSQIDLSDIVEVAFSVYIKFHPLLENQTLPWVIKERLEINRETVLLDLVLIFLSICNTNHLKSKGLCFKLPKGTYEDEGYLVKPLKKSGKPDLDLPSFEKTSKVSELGASEFSLVYATESLKAIIIEDQPRRFKESINIQRSIKTEATNVQKKSQGCCDSCCIIM